MTEPIWKPMPGKNGMPSPQERMITCPVFECFYGGARGGGKTDGMLGEWITHNHVYGANTNGLMVRRTLTELQETIERSKQIYSPLDAKFNEQQKMWRFPNGGRLSFAYLERDSDADNYHGRSYSRLYVEEAGNFPSAGPVDKLRATLRSATNIPCAIRLTGNPGGPGHNWVKERFITPNPKGWEVITEDYENPWTKKTVKRDRIFIPSFLDDNVYLRDTDYAANLQMVGSKELVRAWLDGDWDIVLGAFFDEWRASKHVIEPFQIPAEWIKFRSMDWGYASPCSIGWWAIVQDDYNHFGRLLPRGAMVRYREWYTSPGSGKGLRLTAEDLAAGIKIREKDDRLTRSLCVADPHMFDEDGGPSHAERMARAGVWFRRADNRRLGALGHLGGWDQMRQRLRGDGNRPAIYCFDTCRDSIRTIPVLQHDPEHAEEMQEGEDHAADEWRYACMARPYRQRTHVPKPKGKTLYEMTLNDLWDHRERGQSPTRI